MVGRKGNIQLELWSTFKYISLTSRIEQLCEHGIMCVLYDINMWIHHTCLIAGSLFIPEIYIGPDKEKFRLTPVLKTIFPLNVSYHILVANLTLMALVYDMTH